MNREIVYRWTGAVRQHLKGLGKCRAKQFAFFSLGVIRAEHCHQGKIAKALAKYVKPQSIVRRLRRCLSNENWTQTQFALHWTRWVVSMLPKKRLLLVVDETSVGKGFKAMVVSVGFKRRAIPLHWTVYEAESTTEERKEGQVRMIARMLADIKSVLPEGRSVRVMVDGGIGNSPALCRKVDALGWEYLFRITAAVKMEIDGQVLRPIEQVKLGGRWRGSGTVFIKRGRLQAHVIVIWRKGNQKPWILVTNNPKLSGDEYAKRNHIEQGFKDSKSNGWQVKACQLTCGERMAKFLAILALAQGLTMLLGAHARMQGKARRLVKDEDNKFRRVNSLFKEGIAYLFEYIRCHDAFPPLYDLQGNRLC